MPVHQKNLTNEGFLMNIPFEHSFAPWLPSKIWSTMKVFLFYFFSTANAQRCVCSCGASNYSRKKPKFHQFPENLFDSAINHDDCNVLLAAHSRQVRLDSSAREADSWVFISWIFLDKHAAKSVLARNSSLSGQWKRDAGDELMFRAVNRYLRSIVRIFKQKSPFIDDWMRWLPLGPINFSIIAELFMTNADRFVFRL